MHNLEFRMLHVHFVLLAAGLALVRAVHPIMLLWLS